MRAAFYFLKVFSRECPLLKSAVQMLFFLLPMRLRTLVAHSEGDSGLSLAVKWLVALSICFIDSSIASIYNIFSK